MIIHGSHEMEAWKTGKNPGYRERRCVECRGIQTERDHPYNSRGLDTRLSLPCGPMPDSTITVNVKGKRLMGYWPPDAKVWPFDMGGWTLWMKVPPTGARDPGMADETHGGIPRAKDME